MAVEILCTILRSTPFTVLLWHENRVQVNPPHAEITFLDKFQWSLPRKHLSTTEWFMRRNMLRREINIRDKVFCASRKLTDYVKIKKGYRHCLRISEVGCLKYKRLFQSSVNCWVRQPGRFIGKAQNSDTVIGFAADYHRLGNRQCFRSTDKISKQTIYKAIINTICDLEFITENAHGMRAGWFTFKATFMIHVINTLLKIMMNTAL